MLFFNNSNVDILKLQPISYKQIYLDVYHIAVSFQI